jgi:hypothetical protein
MTEFEELFGEWGRDSAGADKPCSVRTYSGAAQQGERWADAVDRNGLPQFDQQRLVRSADGNEVLSTAGIYSPDLADADVFKLHSRVTLATGRESTVLAVTVNDHEGLFQFVAVSLE